MHQSFVHWQCKLKEKIGIDVASGRSYAAMEGLSAGNDRVQRKNKLRHEIEMAVDYGIGRIIVDGQKELR